MEIRNLKSFMRIAELGSFTQAARALNYEQSTVSAHIKQLESEMGFPLFDRVGKKIYLTKHGHSLVEYASQILQLEEKIMNIGAVTTGEIIGSIRIGAVESIMSSFVIDLLESYLQTYPKVSITLKVGISSAMFNLLRNNDVDIILIMEMGEEKSEFIYKNRHSEKGVFVASPSHPLAESKKIELQDIFNFPIILTGDQSIFQKKVYDMAKKCGKSVIPHIKTESSNLILKLLEKKAAISFLPEYLTKQERTKNRIVPLPVTGYEYYFNTSIVYHKNKLVTPQMQGFMDLVDDYWGYSKEDSQ